MISIRWRLTILLCVAVGTLFIATGVGVFVAMKSLLRAQFDETLTAKARALITASDMDDGEVEIDLTVKNFAGFGKGGDDYFEIRRTDGTEVLRSPSLRPEKGEFPRIGEVEMPQGHEPRIEKAKLGDGSLAHLYVQRFNPKGGKKAGYPELYLVVASPLRGLHGQLAVLATVLGIAGTAALFLMVPVIRLGLRRGLRPLDQLAADIGRIRSEELHQRLDGSKLPAELLPVAESLNDWLGRLEASFERERRFSSHAAHELRTPLAELKSIAELGATWPEEATTERCAEMVTVVNELEALLEKLSLLARADAGHQPVQHEAVDLPATVATALSRLEGKAEQRRIRFDTRVADAEFATDPVLWGAILQNLLGNAVAHAPEGSAVVVEASPGRLAVTNPAPELEPADLSHLFERFWRKDESHNGHDHSGLGMSIVGACATLLGGECRARLSREGELTVEVSFAAK
jgi:signal transduction histidine kinase